MDKKLHKIHENLIPRKLAILQYSIIEAVCQFNLQALASNLTTCFITKCDEII